MFTRYLVVVLVVSAMFGCTQPKDKPEPEAPVIKVDQQNLLSFEVVVEDVDGNPVEGATLNPWALRSSQGHGHWRKERTGGTRPEKSTTDSEGKATVKYPEYANVVERVRTTKVTVTVDHPNHPYLAYEDAEVPRSKNFKVTLPRGSAIEVTVLLDGQQATSDTIHTMWTGGRSWTGETGVSVTDDKKYRIPPIAAGTAQFMFVQLGGNKPTHFSRIENVEIDESGVVIQREVELLPAVQVRGNFSDNVPRPIKNGRVKVETIATGKFDEEVEWFTWAEVKEDGSFVIDDWPRETPMQLIALCDGFFAKSGETPPMVTLKRPRGNSLRAQVFLKPSEMELAVEMQPMGTCHIQLEDAFGKKIKDCNVDGFPNIFWWNSGSQIYCHPLVKGGDFLLTGKYESKSAEGIFAPPFKGKSNEKGEVTIALPADQIGLLIGNDRYQLAINKGRRIQTVEIESGKTLDLKLVLQPKGLDVLGDWEDLAGLVFG